MPRKSAYCGKQMNVIFSPVYVKQFFLIHYHILLAKYLSVNTNFMAIFFLSEYSRL